MRQFFSYFLFLTFFSVFSQEKAIPENPPKIKIDSLYREDQFYIGFYINTLVQVPGELTQKNFSTGGSIGFLRDMPINKKRTFAIAAGIGTTFNNYNQNMAITNTAQDPVYTIFGSKMHYKSNKFFQFMVDVPIEVRWRTSTFESHKFWRFYGGLKLSYLAYDKSIFDEGNYKTTIKGNQDFNKILYGVYLSSGYNSINVYVHYGLNNLFKSGETAGTALKMHPLNAGVIFYIL